MSELTDIEEFSCHNDCVTAFNNELYNDIFTEENIISNKKAVKLLSEKFYGYFLEKGRKKFFALQEDIDQLPFKVLDAQEADFRNDVFSYIKQVEPITIPTAEKLTYRKLIDSIGNFQHTNPIHWKLNKIIQITAWTDRINARISTEAGFGKDSIAGIISGLVDSTANLYGATFAKLEFVLINKLIILNEMGNLKKDDLMSMQEFLLATGAYFNTYTKRTRKTNTTQEQYDISKLSLLIFYNLPSYYQNKAQDYFDQMFTRAVINRFMPFCFDGTLITKFDRLLNINHIMTENKQLYKDIIATLNYYRMYNPIRDIKYKVDRNVIKFSKDLMRYDRTFNVIMKSIGAYAESQEEFDMLTKELYSCYQKYLSLLGKETKKPQTIEPIVEQKKIF